MFETHRASAKMRISGKESSIYSQEEFKRIVRISCTEYSSG